MDFNQSNTKINLMKAFAGESMARNRYTFAASVAKNQNFHSIAAVFSYTAGQEEQHAKIFFNHLSQNCTDKNVDISAGYPVDSGDVLDLLLQSQHNENEEYTNIYPEFAKIAEEEGFVTIAKHFSLIAQIENTHELRFEAIANLVKSGEYFEAAQKENGYA